MAGKFAARRRLVFAVGFKRALERIRVMWQTRSVNANGLRELLRARPFHSLTVRLGSGKNYTIPQREYLWSHPSEVAEAQRRDAGRLENPALIRQPTVCYDVGGIAPRGSEVAPRTN